MASDSHSTKPSSSIAGRRACGFDAGARGLPRARLADLDRHVLVVEAELLGDPQRAKCARPRNAVDAQPRHARLPPALVVRPYTDRRVSASPPLRGTACV